MRLRVGLTGGIGAGKSSVARRLVEHGAHLVDADVVAREVVAPGTPGLAALVEAFGPGVLDASGALDRPALAARVFDDDEARARLNGVVHPLVRERTRQLEAAAPHGAVVVQDVPLLVENGLAGLFDVVVVVDAPAGLRVERLAARGMSADDARARIRSQATRAQRVAAADVLLDNGGTTEDLRSQVDALWARLVDEPSAAGVDLLDVLAVPWWRGSGHPEARRLADGTDVLLGLLPGGRAVRRAAPGQDDVGQDDVGQDDVGQDDALARAAAEVDALAVPGVLVLGGDCSVGTSALRAVHRHVPGDLAVLWLDAHADANDETTSRSGAAHGMALRAACEGWPEKLVGSSTGLDVPASHVVLLGARDLDPGEEAWLADAPVVRLPAAAAADRPGEVLDALRATGCRHVWVHLDVDVLDPVHGVPVGFPAAGGVSPAGLAALLDAVGRQTDVVGAFVGELMPPPVASGREEGREAVALLPVLDALGGAVVGQAS